MKLVLTLLPEPSFIDFLMAVIRGAARRNIIMICRRISSRSGRGGFPQIRVVLYIAVVLILGTVGLPLRYLQFLKVWISCGLGKPPYSQFLKQYFELGTDYQIVIKEGQLFVTKYV